MGSSGPRPALEYVITMVPKWAPWMSKNLLLAVVPVLLAWLLFRGDRRRSPLWWAGVVAFVAFLPNAPYVLADYRWLHGPWLNAWYHDRWRFVPMLPVWALYFGLGFAGFVTALRLAQRYLDTHWSPRAGRIAVLILCLLSAFGIYLGRADLNSWSFVTEPRRVAAVLTDQPSTGSGVRIAFAFVVLLAGYICSVTVFELVRRTRGRPSSTNGSARATGPTESADVGATQRVPASGSIR